MSGDEGFLLILAGSVAVLCWSSWYSGLAQVSASLSPPRRRLGLYLIPVLCLVPLFLTLQYLAATDVQGSAIYLGFYMIVGAGWVGLAAAALPWLGLSPREDVAERGNTAVAIASCGALLAVTLCFAGANVGEGPGWLVVLFCAVLSTGGLMAVWSLLELLTDSIDAITIDRDSAAALRLAAFLIASGLILGNAVAGNWESFPGTLVDFVAAAWPVLVLTTLAVGMERLGAPRPNRPSPSAITWGVLPGGLYLILAGGILGWKGWWN